MHSSILQLHEFIHSFTQLVLLSSNYVAMCQAQKAMIFLTSETIDNEQVK